jgi:membrane associated rhomboid family serine protease
LFGMLGVMWVIALLNALPVLDLTRFGIRPRSIPGLLGIVFAPFLHGGFAHLAANSVPFLVLGGIVLLGGRKVFWSVTVFVILLGGLGVWAVAPGYSIHIGASGLIFGYLGFLLARGFVERSWTWIAVAFVILAGYGSLLWGVLPHQPGVSWQSHLFGFLSGIGAARLLFSPERRLIRGRAAIEDVR